MKKKSIIGLFVCLLGFGATTTSCEDMLTPDMDRYAMEFSGNDTVGFYLGILREVQEVIEQNVLLGDLRSDLAVTTEYSSDSISDIANFRNPEDGDNALLNRAAYYKVINQCNFYLAKVDTMALIRGNYYMRKECAQVELIRAWVYMQLVQNYGRVPFITKPVDRANTGWETNPAEGWVDADNLLDKLKAGVEQAALYEKTLGFPNYGTFETGAQSVSHQLLLFPSDVVLGDLYLLRGHSGDYEKAASHYYDYMVDFYYELGRAGEGTAGYISSTSSTSTEKTYYPTIDDWTLGIATGDIITKVPSASNSFFGMVLTRLPQIYGFQVKSSNTTVGGTNEDGSDATTTSGRISLLADYKYRQVAPSQYFENLAASQIVRDYENFEQVGEDREPQNVLYPAVPDARLVGSAPYVDTEKGRLRFIQKFGSAPVNNSGIAFALNFSFKYMLPIYRMRQVYLRYAEAVNRAGFPRYAFTLLRDGLDADMMPRVLTDSFINIDDEAQTKQECPYLEKGSNLYRQLSVDEVRRAEGVRWLDFSAQYWMDNSGRTVNGAHERGCGNSYAVDTLYTYENVVLKRIADEVARTRVEADAQTARMRILAEGEEEVTDPEEPAAPDRSDYTVLPAAEPAKASAAEINAVETLIADEMALETAYEGYRFYDLMRIARHKNTDPSYTADYGTQWLAWLVSRRALKLQPYEDPTQKDESLFNILLNPSNWYLKGPKE